MRCFAGVTMALALATGAGQAQTVEAPIQQNYQGISISVEKRDALIIIAWPYKVGGNLAICGFHYPQEGGSVPKSTRNSLLRTMIIDLNGSPLNVQPMNFTAYADEATSVAKRSGACSVTNLAWSDDYAKVKLKIYGRRGFIRE